MANFLKQQYPFYYRNNSIWVYATFAFLFTFLFYYLLLPFEINTKEHKFGFFWISCIHAILPAIIMLIQGHVFWLFVKEEDNWSVLREFGFYFIFLLIVGISQFLIRDIIYYNPDNWSLNYFFEEIRNTFLMGGVFITIVIPINFNRLYFKNIKKAQTLEIINSRQTFPVFANISTKVKSENFQLNLDTFLYAKSDGNYLEIVSETEGEITKLLKRLTINELLNQVEQDGNFIKTHRSFLVNLNKIENISGNAAGYKLALFSSNDIVPVSRNHISSFETKLETLNSKKANS